MLASVAAALSWKSLFSPLQIQRTDIGMKAPARQFRLSDWYGDDWDHKKPADDPWVSPWAKAHYKLRQQEIEIEKCMFMIEQAVAEGNFDEAGGLRERADRLRAQHPIIPREVNPAVSLSTPSSMVVAWPPTLIVKCHLLRRNASLRH